MEEKVVSDTRKGKVSQKDLAAEMAGKKLKGKAASVMILSKQKGGTGDGSKKPSSAASGGPKGLVAAASTLAMIKSKMVEEDEEEDEAEEEDISEEEGQAQDENQEEIQDEKTTKEVTLEDIRRIKAKMKTVDQIMIEGDDVEIGSDSDVSDTSQIWSDYGDEITFDKGQKLSKWCASGRVSQRLSMKERGVKVLKNKKKKKKDRLKSEKQKSRGLYSRESEAQLALQAMAHSESGSTSGPPPPEGYSSVTVGKSEEKVYFVDFSEDYKRCLRLARERMEDEEQLTVFEQKEMEWVDTLRKNRSKPLSEKLRQLRLESPRMSPRSQSPRVKRRSRTESATSSGGRSPKQSVSESLPDEDQEDAAATSPKPKVDEASKKVAIKEKSKTGGKKGTMATKGVEHDAMGMKWNKSMWDNMENYWRMVMSKDEFVITPGCYDRQLDATYRYSSETVTFGLLEEARAKCVRWIHINKDHFSL